jgi:hypothetical protein
MEARNEEGNSKKEKAIYLGLRNTPETNNVLGESDTKEEFQATDLLSTTGTTSST